MYLYTHTKVVNTAFLFFGGLQFTGYLRDYAGANHYVVWPDGGNLCRTQTRVIPYSQAKVTLYAEVSGEGHIRGGGTVFTNVQAEVTLHGQGNRDAEDVKVEIIPQNAGGTFWLGEFYSFFS